MGTVRAWLFAGRRGVNTLPRPLDAQGGARLARPGPGRQSPHWFGLNIGGQFDRRARGRCGLVQAVGRFPPARGRQGAGDGSVWERPGSSGRRAAVLWLGMTIWKAVLAANIGVVWEEAHFVVAGMHPALAYPDIPAGWPLFARLCVSLFGWSPLQPVLVLRRASPSLRPSRSASISWPCPWSVGATRSGPACCPSSCRRWGPRAPSSIPEAAMQLLLAPGLLGAMIRNSSAPERLVWWALTGLCAGLGLFVHYRFAAAVDWACSASR